MKKRWITWMLAIALVFPWLFFTCTMTLTKEARQEWELLNPEGVIKIEAMKVNPHPSTLEGTVLTL